MSILSGFFKTKRYRKTTDGYKLESNWTSGNTVELDDGNTVQNNLGAIKGITTSTSVTEEGYAVDATTVAALNNSLDNHNHDDRYYTESEVITKLNTKQNVGWTEVGNVTGTSTVNFSSLKSGKSELALIVTHGQVRTQLIIPIPSNTSVLYMPLPGYFFQTTEQFNVSVAITNKTVSLNVVNYNGNAVTSSSTLGVYIR